MIPAGTATSTPAAIAKRFRVDTDTVANWAAAEGFPRNCGTPKRRAFPDAEVDAWVERHRPAIWRAVHEEPFVSEGHPEDLLDIVEFAALRARRTGRDRPATPNAMLSYISRRQIPQPDRTPGDGKFPQVAGKMWFRRTVDEHVSGLKGSGNRTNHRARERQDERSDS